jgi:hypothetical protein
LSNRVQAVMIIDQDDHAERRTDECSLRWPLVIASGGMDFRRSFAAFGAIALIACCATVQSQEPAASKTVADVDGSDLDRQLRERGGKIAALSESEREKLRAAEAKAVDDPAVKAALAKRDEVIKEFRAVLRESMLKADPSLRSVLSNLTPSADDGTDTP